MRYVYQLCLVLVLSFSNTALWAEGQTGSCGVQPPQATDFFLGDCPLGIYVSYKAEAQPYPLSYNLVNNKDQEFQTTLSFTLPEGFSFSTTAGDNYYACTVPPTPPTNIPINPAQPTKLTLPSRPASCLINVTVLAKNNQNSSGIDSVGMSVKTSDYEVNAVANVGYATGTKATSRQFTMVNNCKYPLNVAISGASVQAINSLETTCTTDDDCYPGSSCVSSQCFWNNPAPKEGYNVQLEPGDVSVYNFPVYDNGFNLADAKANTYKNVSVSWSGAVTARLNCDGGVCEVNDCGAGSDGGCLPGRGIGNTGSPTSQVEFTLGRQSPVYTQGMSTSPQPNKGADTYNLTVINGFTVPMSLSPAYINWDPSTPYTCGSPGLGTEQKAPLGACTWDPKFSSNPNASTYISNFRHVRYETNGGSSPTSCNTDSDCNSAQVCGLSFNPQGAEVTKSCGEPVGYQDGEGNIVGPEYIYWSANGVCTNPSYNCDANGNNCKPKSPFFCSYTVQSQYPSYPNSSDKMSDLFGCDGANLGQSCYTPGLANPSTCCGCIDWWSTAGGNITVPHGTPDTTGACPANQTNPAWNSLFQPMIQWAKAACPTTYTYPFDDMSSTFTCVDNVTNNDYPNPNFNVTSYNVEFCPTGAKND